MVGLGKNVISKKETNEEGEGGKTGEKGKFSLYLGGDVILEKRVRGKIYIFFGNIYPC